MARKSKRLRTSSAMLDFADRTDKRFLFCFIECDRQGNVHENKLQSGFLDVFMSTFGWLIRERKAYQSCLGKPILLLLFLVSWTAVRSGAKENAFWDQTRQSLQAAVILRLLQIVMRKNFTKNDVLSYAATFWCFQAWRSSATRSLLCDIFELQKKFS